MLRQAELTTIPLDVYYSGISVQSSNLPSRCFLMQKAATVSQRTLFPWHTGLQKWHVRLLDPVFKFKINFDP